MIVGMCIIVCMCNMVYGSSRQNHRDSYEKDFTSVSEERVISVILLCDIGTSVWFVECDFVWFAILYQ